MTPAVLLFLTLPLGIASAQSSDTTRAGLTAEQFEARLKYQQGVILLRGGLASVNLPPSFRYLDPEQSEQLLVQGWGNPPGNETLGMLFPTGSSPLSPEGWGVVISYEEEGHVKDDDALGIDYDALLKEMQADTRASNKQRLKAGYQGVELVGWAAKPRYDGATHKLHWAKELRFGDEPGNTLNYNIRILGRRGVLVLNAVAAMDQMAEVERSMATVLGFVDFNAGHRYADFNASTDQVAKYGIAALVAGGIAAKTGLLKVILGALIAAKKLVVVALLGLGALLAKVFRKKHPEAVTPK